MLVVHPQTDGETYTLSLYHASLTRSLIQESSRDLRTLLLDCLIVRPCRQKEWTSTCQLDACDVVVQKERSLRLLLSPELIVV